MQLLGKDTDTEQQWSYHHAIEAHPGCDGCAASVHFDHEGRRVATSMYSSSVDSAWKVWSAVTGVSSLSLICAARLITRNQASSSMRSIPASTTHATSSSRSLIQMCCLQFRRAILCG